MLDHVIPAVPDFSWSHATGRSGLAAAALLQALRSTLSVSSTLSSGLGCPHAFLSFKQMSLMQPKQDSTSFGAVQGQGPRPCNRALPSAEQFPTTLHLHCADGTKDEKDGFSIVVVQATGHHTGQAFSLPTVKAPPVEFQHTPQSSLSNSERLTLAD